jgi:hypothetical protein
VNLASGSDPLISVKEQRWATAFKIVAAWLHLADCSLKQQSQN